jgi:hypothetical protein
MDTTAKIGSPSDCLLAYRHSESVLKHDESILAGLRTGRRGRRKSELARCDYRVHLFVVGTGVDADAGSGERPDGVILPRRRTAPVCHRCLGGGPPAPASRFAAVPRRSTRRGRPRSSRAVRAAAGSASGATISSTSVPNCLPSTVSVLSDALAGSRITLWPRNSIRRDAGAQLFSSEITLSTVPRPRRQRGEQQGKFGVQLIGSRPPAPLHKTWRPVRGLEPQLEVSDRPSACLAGLEGQRWDRHERRPPFDREMNGQHEDVAAV